MGATRRPAWLGRRTRDGRGRELEGDRTAVDVKQWPPDLVLPTSAPNEGFRPDRHGYDGFQYKLWVGGEGLESAVYCGPRCRGQVLAFLRVAHDAVSDASAYPDSDPAVCLDVMAAADLTLEQIGMMFDPDGGRPGPTVDQFRKEALMDLELRMKAG